MFILLNSNLYLRVLFEVKHTFWTYKIHKNFKEVFNASLPKDFDFATIYWEVLFLIVDLNCSNDLTNNDYASTHCSRRQFF